MRRVRYLARLFISQSVVHFLLFIFSAFFNQETCFSMILFWLFFTTQNLVSFGYICDSHLRHRDGRDPLPYLLLHAVCCWYGLFGVIFGMHILPHPLNNNGFAYKIILWSPTNYLLYSHIWYQIENSFGFYYLGTCCLNFVDLMIL